MVSCCYCLLFMSQHPFLLVTGPFPLLSFCFCSVYLHTSLLVPCLVPCIDVWKRVSCFSRAMLNCSKPGQGSAGHRASCHSEVGSWKTSGTTLQRNNVCYKSFEVFVSSMKLVCKWIVLRPIDVRVCLSSFYSHSCLKSDASQTVLVSQVAPVASICQFFLQNVIWCHFFPWVSVLFELLTISPIPYITESF